ncbi:MAG: dienelactone hydrolase family protein [Flavipsychrobacter sp.]|nr:dienelactone hydrolase family protein [Flavipsychrobacter sp.]
MKRIFLVAVWQCLTLLASAQSCCVQQGSDFQLLAMNDDFQGAHLSPEPFAYTPKEFSSMITFKTDDAKDGRAFYVPSSQATHNVLIIFHEWWGLNDYIKKEAERWQELLGNVDVYAIDLYDGQVAAEAKDAARLSQALDKKRGEVLVKGLIAKIGINHRIATLGWCMGGSWSFTATRMLDKRAAGCVMYYGFPEKDEDKVKELKTDVLYIYATQDKFITKDDVDYFEKQVLATGKGFERHDYNAVHAFANPSNPQFAAKEAKAAEVFAVEFLKKRLQL